MPDDQSHTTMPVILPDSDEAATAQSKLVWQARTGQTVDDETVARWLGSTHERCSCGQIIERGTHSCEDCAQTHARERYAQMVKGGWDGKSALYSIAMQTFYPSPDAAQATLEPGEPIDTLQLVICTPIVTEPLSAGLICDLPFGAPVPSRLQAAIELFNSMTQGLVVGWKPIAVAWDPAASSCVSSAAVGTTTVARVDLQL